MPKAVTEYRCLIISPGDVEEERKALVDVIHRWNASVGENRGLRVEPVRWETHAHPDMSGPAQAKVNEQIVDQCDFGIAVFWSRVGTPTTEHGSGSIEEIERLLGRGAKVMLYRSSRPIPPDRLDTKQFAQLEGLFKEYGDRGLLGRFSDINELRERANSDLSLLLARSGGGRGASESPEVETVARPDVRVSTRVVISMPLPQGNKKTALQITIQNHSPRTFFLSSVGMKMSDGHGLWFRRDSLAGTPNAAQTIESGNSYAFHVAPDDFEDIEVDQIVCAEAHDKIGRVFSSDPELTKRALEVLMKKDQLRSEEAG